MADMLMGLNDDDAKRASTPMFTPGMFEVTLTKVVEGKNTRTFVPNLVIECRIDKSDVAEVPVGSTKCQIYSRSSDYFKQSARAFFVAAVRAQAKVKGVELGADDAAIELDAETLKKFIGEAQPLKGLRLHVEATAGKDPKYTNVRFRAL